MVRRYAVAQAGGDNFTRLVGGREFDARVPFSVIVSVGEQCNSWMGRTFEAPAKPILLPLIDGWPQSLLPQAQEIVARWVAKTAIIDAIGHSVRPPDRVYREFRRTGDPPAGSRVLLGRYSSPGVNQYSRPRFVRPQSTGGAPVDLEFLPFSAILGQLIVLFCLPLRGPDVRTVAEARGKLLPIWPPADAPVTWPPAGLDDQAAPDSSTWELFS